MHAPARALSCGLFGALALTTLHQAARRMRPDAPRMDIVGMRALSSAIEGLGGTPPPDRRLYRWTLAGDLLANTIYYAAIPASTSAATWTRAAVLGTAAGLAALLLPRPLGLDDPPHSDLRANQLMTLAWYLAGALAAAAVSAGRPRG